MAYRFGQRSLDNLKGVHPDLVRVFKKAITDSPVDFTIVEGVRSTERQKQLFAQGRTVKGLKVTNADGVRNKSNHQAKADGFGHAVDIYPFFLGAVHVQHKDTIKNLKLIAVHIKAVAKCEGIKITCGIDWKNPYDPPHFQLK